MTATTEKYVIVLEKSRTGFSAYSPDVLGCAATGKTIEKTLESMKLVLKLHLQGMLEDGEKIPKSRGIDAYIDAARDSEEEDYYITHISIESVLPDKVSA